MDAPLVTVEFHRVSRTGVPLAIARMGLDRAHLRRTPGLRFAKLLGTGDGRTFDIRDADLRTWGLVAVWDAPAAWQAFRDRSAVSAAWARIASESWRAELRPLASRGRWSGQEPFGAAGAAQSPEPTAADRGPVAALTRARLRPGRMRRFWRAVPAVNADLQGQPGLRLAIGIGEAPVGRQGTFSVWESAAALTAFAYRGEAHRRVIADTREQGWYTEELFARFALVRAEGTVRGLDLLADGPRGAGGPGGPPP